MTSTRRPRTTVAGTHADWLRLVEPSGPFLTLPVLRRVWPNGLDHLDTEARAEVRRRAADLDPDDPASVTAWIEWVLKDLLSYGHRLKSGPEVPPTLVHVAAEHGTVVRPDHVLDDGTGSARLLVAVHPAANRLDARPAGDRWSAAPVERLALLCRATGVEIGVATNGASWVLVWAPNGGASGTATFRADLFSEEPVLLDAFTSVLGARRFFAVAEPDRLEALLAESASAQAEVTGKLGQQVRQAVELLVAAISRADRDREGALLSGINAHRVYEAGVAVLMRVVLLLYSEERNLLPLGDELYDSTLAASTLLEQLREIQAETGDEPLERSHTAWYRLLALFRVVHAGIAHDRLRIPAYGGGLFNPDRFPFLEGRVADQRWRDSPSEPLPVDDLTVLAMLAALQELRFTEGGVTETRRLTYRSLDVEQIGHVYEGLLDHSAVAVERTAVGLVGKLGNEPEVAIDDLAHHSARGRDAFVAWLTEITGLTANRIERMLDTELDADTMRLLRAACDNDETLAARLAPYVHLLRRDLRGLPTVFPAGSMYVTQTGAKRDSGTAYTTKELADEVVEHALAPLAYSPGPAEGAEPSEWKLRPSADLLDLKICDPAVGSGAILVAACRYLADRLVEAWTAEGSPDADGDPDEVLITARRAIADRCLYGVDRDPMAVEMAKLSLWLVTLSKERPFTFLDHALKAGDSLLGVTDLDQLRALHLDPVVGRAKVALSVKPDAVEEAVTRAIELRRALESIPVVTVRDAEEKARLNAVADEALETLWTVGDLVVGCALRAELPREAAPEDQIAASALLISATLDDDEQAEIRESALATVAARAVQAVNAGRPDEAPPRHPLHWPLAFPEVFVDRSRPGFDAMVGNPPFLGGKRISGRIGDDYRSLLVRWVAEGRRGNADLIAYFFCRGSQLVRRSGDQAFLATNTVKQGETRTVGLDAMIANGAVIYRAVTDRPWPGAASVVIDAIWIRHGEWDGALWLDDHAVKQIDGGLRARTRTADPDRMAANRARAFIGFFALGTGFLLTPEEARALEAREPTSREILFPYANGQDLTTHPRGTPSRWAIFFGDLSLEEVASRYPEALALIRERVKPERDRVKRKANREIWWQFAETQPGLRRATHGNAHLIAIPRVSKYPTPVVVAADVLLSEKVVVLAGDDWHVFGVLSSTLHAAWVVERAVTLGSGSTLTYSPPQCFETFPQPAPADAIDTAAEALNEHRSALMIRNEEGLTRTYNRVHNPDDHSPGIQELRDLHVALDLVVRDSYGWSDLELDHGFRDTPQGPRYTFSPAARTEVLDRLLELNHQRYAEEVAAGLHDTNKKAGLRRGASDAPTLL